MMSMLSPRGGCPEKSGGSPSSSPQRFATNCRYQCIRRSTWPDQVVGRQITNKNLRSPFRQRDQLNCVGRGHQTACAEARQTLAFLAATPLVAIDRRFFSFSPPPARISRDRLRECIPVAEPTIQSRFRAQRLSGAIGNRGVGREKRRKGQAFFQMGHSHRSSSTGPAAFLFGNPPRPSWQPPALQIASKKCLSFFPFSLFPSGTSREPTNDRRPVADLSGSRPVAGGGNFGPAAQRQVPRPAEPQPAQPPRVLLVPSELASRAVVDDPGESGPELVPKTRQAAT